MAVSGFDIPVTSHMSVWSSGQVFVLLYYTSPSYYLHVYICVELFSGIANNVKSQYVIYYILFCQGLLTVEVLTVEVRCMACLHSGVEICRACLVFWRWRCRACLVLTVEMRYTQCLLSGGELEMQGLLSSDSGVACLVLTVEGLYWF